MTKAEQLAAAHTKLEEARKLLRDAGEELLAELADQLATVVDREARPSLAGQPAGPGSGVRLLPLLGER
jgi:hypothetical protein